MTISDLKAALTAAVNTLNTISVRGRDDLNHMLATISMLERIAREADAIGDPAPEPGADHDKE